MNKNITDEQLVKAAEAAMKYAYSPYSDFKVGAAILTTDGNVFTGCNIENASYGATICAERTAAVKAVSEGHPEFLKIAIVSSFGEYTYPCGICRQFLSEFFRDDGILIINDKQNGIKTIKFFDMIPNSFSGESLH